MGIAEAIANAMRRDGVQFLGWGDNRIVDYVGALSKRQHPLERMDAGLRAMEKRPDLFVKHKRRSSDIYGRRNCLVRCYELRRAA